MYGGFNQIQFEIGIRNQRTDDKYLHYNNKGFQEVYEDRNKAGSIIIMIGLCNLSFIDKS